MTVDQLMNELVKYPGESLVYVADPHCCGCALITDIDIKDVKDESKDKEGILLY